MAGVVIAAARVSYHLPMTRCWSQPKNRNTTTPSSDDMITAANSSSPSRLLAYLLEQLADAGVALAEEEVADDGADHRQPGGDAQAGEDRRQGGREHQLAQPGPAAGVLAA